jgi:hypothetical protein
MQADSAAHENHRIGGFAGKRVRSSRHLLSDPMADWEYFQDQKFGQRFIS